MGDDPLGRVLESRCPFGQGPSNLELGSKIQAGSGTGVSAVLDREARGTPVVITPCGVLLAGPRASSAGRSRLRADAHGSCPTGQGRGRM